MSTSNEIIAKVRGVPGRSYTVKATFAASATIRRAGVEVFVHVGQELVQVCVTKGSGEIFKHIWDI